MPDRPSALNEHTTPQRADWLRALARAPADEVDQRAAPVVRDYRFEWLREPESGLMMVRARIGNTGDRFNLGEVTVTRCAVRHTGSGGESWVGVGHVLGRSRIHAERIAQLDALMQRGELRALLWRDVVWPLVAARTARDHDERARTEASRVRFFTLQAEAA